MQEHPSIRQTNSTMRNIAFLSFFVSLFFSCSEQSSTETETAKYNQKYSFQVVDTLYIDFMGDLRLMEVNEESGRMLGINGTNGEIVELNIDGSLIGTYDRKEGPNGYGRFIEKIGFFGSDKRVLETPTHILIYDSDWNIIEKIENQSEAQFYVINMAKQAAQIVEWEGSSHLILNTNDSDYRKYEKSEEPFYRFKLLNLETGEKVGAFPLASDDPYLQIPDLNLTELKPQFQWSKNRVYIKMPLSNEIEIWEKAGGEYTLKKFTPSLENMDLPPAIPSQRVASNEDFWLSFKNGLKNGSFTFGSYPMAIDGEEVVFISYRTPLSSVLIDELKDNDFEAYSRLSKMVNAYHFPIVNGEVGYPELEFSAIGPKYRIGDQQFILKMSLEDFDEEPDMIPYLKYELVKEL